MYRCLHPRMNFAAMKVDVFVAASFQLLARRVQRNLQDDGSSPEADTRRVTRPAESGASQDNISASGWPLQVEADTSPGAPSRPLPNPTQRSAPIQVALSTHDAHDGKPHKYKRDDHGPDAHFLLSFSAVI
jgi:hypothetical protein